MKRREGRRKAEAGRCRPVVRGILLAGLLLAGILRPGDLRAGALGERKMNLSAVPDGEGRVELSWDRPEIDGLSGFRVLRGVGVDPAPFPVAVLPASAPARQRFVDRIPGNTGYVFVYRVLGLGEKDRPLVASETVAFRPPDTRPPARPVITALESREGFVRVAWNASTEPDLAGYNVYRRDPGAGGEEAERLNDPPVPGTVFEDRGIRGGRLYRYHVTAVDGSGNESALSEGRSVRGTVPVKAAVVSGLEIRRGPDGSPELRWSDGRSPDLRGYVVYRQARAGAPWIAVSGRLEAPAFTDRKAVDASGVYRVRALYRGGVLSEASEPVEWSGEGEDEKIP